LSKERRVAGWKVVLAVAGVGGAIATMLLGALGGDDDPERIDEQAALSGPGGTPERAAAEPDDTPSPPGAPPAWPTPSPGGVGPDARAAAPAAAGAEAPREAPGHDAGAPRTESARVQPADGGAAKKTANVHPPRKDGGAPPKRAGEVAAASPASEAAHPDAGTPPDGGTRSGGARQREAARGAAGRDRRSGGEDFVWVARFVATGGASLEGRVVDAETGRPLSGIAVEARLGRRLMATSTDGSGGFRMDGMLPGSRVTVWAGGASDPFVPERIEARIPGEGLLSEAGTIRLLRGDELAPNLNGWVGLTVSRRGGHVVVSAVSPWLSADRARIEVGDIVVSIDGRDLSGLGSRAVTFLLRGPIGSTAQVVAESSDQIRRTVLLQRVPR
jgi:hypothetical protein